jgi:hypothetical protein
MMKQIKLCKTRWVTLTLFLLTAVLLIALVPFKNVQAGFSGKLFPSLNVQSFSLLKPADQSIPLRLASGEFDPLIGSQPESANERFSIKSYFPGQPGYFLVQFEGPVKTAHKKALEQAGARIFDYIPDFAFIVKMDAAARLKAEALNYVRWVGIYQPAYRIAPGSAQTLEKSQIDRAEFVISIFQGEDLQTIVFQIQSAGGEALETAAGSRAKIRARLTAAALENVAAVNGVQWIEPAPQWKLLNDQAAGISGVTNVWENHGLFGSGQIVAVADTGLDKGSTSPGQLHHDFWDANGNSRVVQLYDLALDGASSDVNSGHGTHVAGSILGNGIRSGSTPTTHQYSGSYAGMAPEASLVFQAVENNSTGDLSGIPLDLHDLFLQTYNVNARIHSNSWGDPTSLGTYSSYAEDVDDFMWTHKNFLILFAAGNEGKDANHNGVIDLGSIETPATAKNCLSVGASENNRPSGSSPTPAYNINWGTGSWISLFPVAPIYGDHVSNNPDGMAAFSSRGPCLDGRIKPDIVAPGTNIISTRSSAATETLWGSGGLSTTYYTFSGGTSMATPLTAGAAALVRQYYTDIEVITPSAALIKATLLNGAFDMTPGQYGTGSYKEIPTRPNNVEGWGRLDLMNSLFPASPRQFSYYDQGNGQTTSGVTHTYNFTADNTSPLKVTLVWTDYPGTPAANGALVNDLDLTLLDPTEIVHYSNGNNPPNPFDRRNNIEGIDLGSPVNGTYSTLITGYNVPQGPQPYALVASGGNLSSLNLIYSASNLQVTANDQTQINLTWSDNSNNESGFKIERKTGSGLYTLIYTTGADATAYSDTSVSFGSTYFYRIKAFNASGDAASSNEAIILFGFPAAPSGVTTTSVTSSRISLHWTDNSIGETGFRVERKSGVTDTWGPVGTTAESVVNFSDNSCASQTTYYYRVFAYDTFGDSPPSNEVMAVTPAASTGNTGGGGGGRGGCFIASTTSGSLITPAGYGLKYSLGAYVLLLGLSLMTKRLVARRRHQAIAG